MSRWNNEPLAGYLVLGSNGEAPYLSEPEKLSLIAATAERSLPGRTIFAGTGLESTRETIRLTNLAAGLGAHAALIITPSFYGVQMNDESLVGHFQRVADASRIPVFVYNVPAYTKLSISVAAIERLSSHPNIAGMKESSGDIPRVELILKAVPGSFQVIIGSASVWYPALRLGVRAGILALANIAGTACARLQELYDAGNLGAAEALHRKLVPVNAAVTTTYGVAGLKCAARLLGYRAGVVRSPLIGLSGAAEEEIRKCLFDGGMLEE